MVLHNNRVFATLGAAAVAALLLAGCSSTPATTTTAAAGSNASAASDTVVSDAQAVVDKFTTDDPNGFIPTDPITDVATLKGKVVYYVPAVAQIPIFQTAFAGYKDALSQVGITAKLCDGQSNPSAVAACFQQAIDNHAAGVILDSLPPAIAQQAYDAVLAAKIPVLLSTTGRPDGSPDSVQLGGPDLTAVTAHAADVIIADSKGKAHVLTIKSIDSATTISWMENGAEKEFADKCPGCTFTDIQIKSADLQSLPSKVSAALLADPTITYLLPQFSAEVKGALQGASDAGRSDIKAVNTVTTVADIPLLQQASSPLIASVGYDIVREAWINSDLLMRLIVKQPVDASQYVVPVHIFTKENSKSLDATQAGWSNSSWFGGTGYHDQLEALWGK